MCVSSVQATAGNATAHGLEFWLKLKRCNYGDKNNKINL